MGAPSEKEPVVAASSDESEGQATTVSAGSQHLHRKLRGNEVQMFALGAAIGTCKQDAHLSFVDASV